MYLRDFYNRFSLDESLAGVAGHNPYYRRIDSGLDEKILVNGHEMIDLASNNYLGLATDGRVKQAAVEAVQKYGVSLCGTPIATGYIDLYQRMEEKLSSFVGLEETIILPSCYQANNGLFSSIAGPQDLIVVDRFAHSSLIQGIKSAGCKIRPFLHNNPGIKNILITGSNSVYGEENSPVIKDEDSPYNSHYRYFGDSLFPCKLNYYRDTKALAKKEALAFAATHNLNLIILEPVWVYGERELNGGFYEYLKTAKAGIPFVPGAKHNKFHVIYAGDLARAYFLAYEKQLAGLNCILVGNEQAESMDRIYGLFCSEAGLKKPGNLSKVLTYPAALLMELLYTIVSSPNPPLLTRGRVNMFYDNLEFSVEKARRILGFRNSFSLEEGIKRTVLWYKEQGLI